MTEQRYAIELTQNEVLALCRVISISNGSDTVPLDTYERELLETFLEGAKEAINSPGTFTSE